MQNSATSSRVAPQSLKLKHEVSEKHVRNALIVGLSAAFLVILSLAACAVTIHLLAKARPMQPMEPLGIIIAPNLKPLGRFPGPNLQIDDDHAQRVALDAAQTEKLNGYGWVDRAHGIVHLPIDRAMDLLLQRGLPTRTNGLSQTGGSPLQLIQKIHEAP